jgi:alkylation response protein AidB-like acyl-CoA dehydrogenase
MTAESADLVGLTASRTGPLRCENVHVSGDFLLAGPVAEVMKTGAGAKTGGVQTSILALGLAASALDYLDAEALKRPELEPPTMALRCEWQSLCDELFAHLDGSRDCDYQIMRTRANSHVLRATQAGLAAAKGTGYVTGHSTGRWCREALFFLVWSCPQPVLAANLCELAGISES